MATPPFSGLFGIFSEFLKTMIQIMSQELVPRHSCQDGAYEISACGQGIVVMICYKGLLLSGGDGVRLILGLFPR